jgi:hypothetical protein
MKSAFAASAVLVVVGLCVSECDHGYTRQAGVTGTEPTLAWQTGLAPVSDQPWNRMTGNGWNYLRRTSSQDDDIQTDPEAPFTPQHVLRIVFTPDMIRDTEPSVHWIRLSSPTEVYAAWWIKLSATWKSSPAGGGKMTFLHTTPSGQGQVYSALFGATAPHHISINTEWAPYGQKIWDPNLANTPIVYNRWYHVEWHVRWSTAPDAADGIVRWSVDGVPNGSYANVVFPSGGVGFQQFEFAPTLQNPPRAVQYMYVGHTYVYAR